MLSLFNKIEPSSFLSYLRKKFRLDSFFPKNHYLLKMETPEDDSQTSAIFMSRDKHLYYISF